jgi:hypothetical protein
MFGNVLDWWKNAMLIKGFAGDDVFSGGAADIDLSTAGLMKKASIEVEDDDSDDSDPESDVESGSGSDTSSDDNDDSASDDSDANDDVDDPSESEDSDSSDDDSDESDDGDRDYQKLHHNDQQYIRELETKNKRLFELIEPFVKEREDGSYDLDAARLMQVRGEQEDSQGLDEESRKKANENFWDAMQEDAIGTLFDLFSKASERSMAPIKQDMVQRRTSSAIEDLHKSTYGQYGDFRNEVKEILSKDSRLAKLGPRGVELAYGEVIKGAMAEIVKQSYEDGKKAAEKQPGEGVSAPSGSSGATGADKKSPSEQIRDSIFGESKDRQTLFG